MAISQEELRIILHKKFPNASIDIKDTAGDQDHYFLEIKDGSFRGLSLITQHKMVKDALKEILNTKLHSISIKTVVSED